jgi:Zn-dependent protease with chaperone function
MSSIGRPFPRRRNLALWAALGLVMVVFSYALTLTLALLCLALSIGGVIQQISFGSVVLFFAGGTLGLTILWSIVPRRDQFEAPGTRIDPAEQPRLLGEIRSLAAQLGEPLPAEIYLIPDLNAWVSDRGGLCGFGSRRILAIGLPLFGMLSVGELRAVLAHEFAHYYGGDTKLGRRVFDARRGMEQTLRRLTSDSPLVAILNLLGRVGVVRILQLVVIGSIAGYWRLFFRVTNLLSRRQEFRADELAAIIAGGPELSEGLKRIESSAWACPMYWSATVGPAWNAGFCPPLAAGFGQYLHAPRIADAVSKGLQHLMANGKTDKNATHPPLRDRVEAVSKYKSTDRSGGSQPAVSLLDHLDRLEVALLEFLTRKQPQKTLRRVDWQEVSDQVWVSRWKQELAEHAVILIGATVNDLADLLHRAPQLAAQIRDEPGTLPTREQRAQRVCDLIIGAMNLALLRAGWAIHGGPGDYWLSRGDIKLDPPAAAISLLSDATARAAWPARATELGIARLPLSAIDETASTPASREAAV